MLFDDQLYREEKRDWGIPSAKSVKLSRFDNDNGAIVFNGPTNAQRTDTAIKFPTDDGEIDLSGSFTLTNSPSSTAKPPSMLNLIYGAFANCYVYSQNGSATLGSANSGIIIYPNGTQAVYSKCEVAQIIM